MYQQIQFQYHPILTNAEGYADPTAAAVLIDEERARISNERTARILKKTEEDRKPTYRLAWTRTA